MKMIGKKFTIAYDTKTGYKNCTVFKLHHW